jgi:hypothetical protein
VTGRLRDDRGTTLVELMVGLAMGMVVMAGLAMVIITTMRGSDRVTARVDGTQRARLVVTQITEELHSACIWPQAAPILPESTGKSLAFTHAVGSQAQAVAPTPTKSVITLGTGGTLTQSDYAWEKGSYPHWEFAKTATTKTLLTKVGPLTPEGPIFTYYKFVNGNLVAVPATEKIEGESAWVIQVQVALNATPTTTPVADPGADSSLMDAAVLRLTPPAFPEAVTARPCQ